MQGQGTRYKVQGTRTRYEVQRYKCTKVKGTRTRDKDKGQGQGGQGQGEGTRYKGQGTRTHIKQSQGIAWLVVFTASGICEHLCCQLCHHRSASNRLLRTNTDFDLLLLLLLLLPPPRMCHSLRLSRPHLPWSWSSCLVLCLCSAPLSRRRSPPPVTKKKARQHSQPPGVRKLAVRRDTPLFPPSEIQLPKSNCFFPSSTGAPCQEPPPLGGRRSGRTTALWCRSGWVVVHTAAVADSPACPRRSAVCQGRYPPEGLVSNSSPAFVSLRSSGGGGGEVLRCRRRRPPPPPPYPPPPHCLAHSSETTSCASTPVRSHPAVSPSTRRSPLLVLPTRSLVLPISRALRVVWAVRSLFPGGGGGDGGASCCPPRDDGPPPPPPPSSSSSWSGMVGLMTMLAASVSGSWVSLPVPTKAEEEAAPRGGLLSTCTGYAERRPARGWP